MSSIFVINVTVMTCLVTLIIVSTNGVDSKMCELNEGHVLQYNEHPCSLVYYNSV